VSTIHYVRDIVRACACALRARSADIRVGSRQIGMRTCGSTARVAKCPRGLSRRIQVVSANLERET